MSGGMSSSSESSSSDSSGAVAAASLRLCARCIANKPLRFLDLFFALRQRFLRTALRVATASGSWPSSPAGGVSAKASTSLALIEAVVNGNRIACSDVSRRWSRARLSRGSCEKAFVSIARMGSKWTPLVNSTLIASLINSSSMVMFCKRLGTWPTFRIMSSSRSWGRKTLMLKVTTTKVCKVAFRFCHSIIWGPHAGVSYSAGRMLRTYGIMMSCTMVL
mmetsp:Transcript_40622/g.91635  ORF Transcript_40622/g.91635 Transcript_40622/m.91635 type:complete len:220 (+) Transcript_40622:780-1439(+)